MITREAQCAIELPEIADLPRSTNVNRDAKRQDRMAMSHQNYKYAVNSHS